MTGTQKITMLTDVDLPDHTELDKHFQFIVNKDWKITEWCKAIEEGSIKIKCKIVLIMVGQVDLRNQTEGKIGNKLRKLVMHVFNLAGMAVMSVYTASILPQADAEVVYQEMVWEANGNIAKMSKDVKKYQHRMVTYLP